MHSIPSKAMVSCRVEYKAGDGKTSMMETTILIVPEKPGSAHTFGQFTFPTPPPPKNLPQRLKQGLPKVAIAAGVGFFALLGVPKAALMHVFGGNKVANQVDNTRCWETPYTKKYHSITLVKEVLYL